MSCFLIGVQLMGRQLQTGLSQWELGPEETEERWKEGGKGDLDQQCPWELSIPQYQKDDAMAIF